MTFISIFASLLLSANSVADTSVVVSEPTVISSDTTVQTVLPDSAVIAEQHIKDTAAVVAKDTTVAEKDTAEGWHFTTVDSVAITPVKDQHRSGTCWAFSTLGFLESEVLRTKGKEVDFAEMFVVNKTMMDRATYCVRMYNDVKFAAGGSAYDVIYCMKHYGLVPQEAMPGIRYGSSPADTLPVHTELDKVASGYLNALTGLKKLTPVWREGLQAIYNTYLGRCPKEFKYEGEMYTPQSFVEELGLDADEWRQRICRSRQGRVHIRSYLPSLRRIRRRDFARRCRFVRLLLVVRSELGQLLLRVGPLLQFALPRHVPLLLPLLRAVCSSRPRVHRIASGASASNSSIL